MAKYTNDGVAHAFAHAQPGESGESHNGNFFFIGDTLYSYGYRYPVAVIIDRENRIALFNSDSSSVTTEGKHKNAARRALSHFTLHYIPNLDQVARAWRNGKLQMPGGDLARYVESRAKCMEKLADKYKRLRAEWTKANNLHEQAMHENAARLIWKLAGRRGDCFNVASKQIKADLKKRRADQLEAGLNLVRNAAQVDVSETVAQIDRIMIPCAHVGEYDLRNFEDQIDRLVNVFPRIMPGGMADKTAIAAKGRAWIESAIAEQEACHERNASIREAWHSARKAIVARRAELNRESVEGWKRGESCRYPHSAPMALRIKGDILETSMGARVPLFDAISLTRFAAHCRITGNAWKRNGETRRVGQFQCDRITDRGDIIAGCHTIPWAAIVDCVVRHRAELPDSLKNAVLDGESV